MQHLIYSLLISSRESDSIEKKKEKMEEMKGEKEGKEGRGRKERKTSNNFIESLCIKNQNTGQLKLFFSWMFLL